MKKYFLTLFIVMSSLSTFSQDFDLQGHRGARGLYPENSIPGFLKALEIGVTTLEMDVVITADRQVIVSHEPWFNSSICLQPDGSEIGSKKGKEMNIFQMSYAQVSSHDCGSKENKEFPDQKKIKTIKPLLKSVIMSVEEHIQDKTGYPVNYNIEIKSEESGDGIYHPEPEEFSKLVYNLVDSLLTWDRVTIQSFDPRILQFWNTNYENGRLAYLISNTRSIEKNIAQLGFKPDIYSPYFKLLSTDKVEYLHSEGIQCIPWTVNTKKDMIEVKDMGVDGLITDYPNRAVSLGLGVKIPYETNEK